MGLKSKIAIGVLNSKLSLVAREKKVFNLDSAQTAGILWEIGQKDSFDRMKDELAEARIKTSGLCYFPLRMSILPEEIIGFSRKQTNYWTQIPSLEVVDDFVHQKFDLLIDLTGQRHFPVLYITALSEANFKIGYAGSSQNYFDLNIDFQAIPETSQLVDQILYYLKRINKTTIE